MIEREVEIETPDGVMRTFIFHPEEEGPHPVVLYYMDAPSIRPALKDMASRLASAGYYVMLPFLYYRNSPFREFGASDEDMHARSQLMGAITKDGAVRDAASLLAFADRDPNAAPGKIGAVGFCMSGPLVIALANAMPERVAAAASVHGAWFVTDKPDSTHLNLTNIKGELYFAWADNDQTAPVADMECLESALRSANARYRIDFFQNAVHGFAPQGPRYHRYASEKHWERVHALLQRTIG
ncbi:MAG: dienelactone hydrolase family protein [Caulobacterales bacterium]